MAVSGTSALNDVINTEIIALDVLEEAREQTFMPSLVLNKDISGQGSLTANFARFASLAAAGLTETSDLSETEVTTAQAGQITADAVGVRVDLTDKAVKANGGRIDVPEIVALCGRALAAKIETDLCAVFASASQSVGSTGVDLSLANIEDAIYTLKLGQARIGNPTLSGASNFMSGVNCVLHTRQASDFRTALRAANLAFMTPAEMAVWMNAGTFGSGFMGVYQGVSFWESTKPATANNGDDRVGAMFVPRAIGFVTVGGPEIELQRDASFRLNEVVAVQYYGAGEVADSDYVKIVTDA